MENRRRRSGFIILIGLRIAREYERGVIFRLGRYVGIRGPGLYWIIPFGIERSSIIDIRVRTIAAEQQETITRDSVTIKVNAVLWYKITDAMEASIKLKQASENIAGNPAALELRRMQMVTEVGAENNSTTVIMIPSDFANLAKSLGDYFRENRRPPN